MLMCAVPAHIDPTAVHSQLLAIPNVIEARARHRAEPRPSTRPSAAPALSRPSRLRARPARSLI